MKIAGAWNTIKETVHSFSEDRVMRLSAALAYYSLFAIGALLVLIVGVVGLVFGEDAVRQQVQQQAQSFMGSQGASAVQTMMSAHHSGGTLAAAILGVVGLVLSASGLFGQLQDALNTIWEVQPRPDRGIMGYVWDRFLSISMVMGVAILLFVFMVLSSVLNTLSSSIGNAISLPGWLILVFNGIVSFLIISVLFAVIFKYLPDTKIQWRDVWVGALVTSALFTIGKYLLSLYLGTQGSTSAYGAAGAIVVLLLFVYYSSIIFFFGAEFTKAYARQTGSPIAPSTTAVKVTEEQRAQEGRPTEERVEEATRKQDRHDDDSHLPKAA